ncbi:MAG: hypothetical protein U1F57_07530 [bacterium]
MKKIFLAMAVVLGLTFSSHAWAIPVYSVNGFKCSKVGVTVTCKGPIPGGDDSLTVTGHGLVYVTMDVHQGGHPTRYTYFSDTGCLVGYTFGMDGKVINAVAVHRNGTKGSFDVKEENYDPMVSFCEQDLPNSPTPVADTQSPQSSTVAKKSPTSAPAPAPAAKPAVKSAAKPAAKPAPKK